MIAVPSMLIVAPSGIVNEEIFLLTPSSSNLLMFIGTVAFDDEVEKANPNTGKNFFKNLNGFAFAKIVNKTMYTKKS